jgi:hypothetical protein
LDDWRTTRTGARQCLRTPPCACAAGRAAARAPGGLGNQIVFGTFHGALQVALHRGHVVHRLGHHAGQFLHAREAVELQRVEACGRVLGQRHARLHLRLGLHFDVTQLLTQAIQVAGQVD